jgi:hypothetical protein
MYMADEEEQEYILHMFTVGSDRGDAVKSWRGDEAGGQRRNGAAQS